jgi:hypothetical protein
MVLGAVGVTYDRMEEVEERHNISEVFGPAAMACLRHA